MWEKQDFFFFFSALNNTVLEIGTVSTVDYHGLKSRFGVIFFFFLLFFASFYFILFFVLCILFGTRNELQHNWVYLKQDIQQRTSLAKMVSNNPTKLFNWMLQS